MTPTDSPKIKIPGLPGYYFKDNRLFSPHDKPVKLVRSGYFVRHQNKGYSFSANRLRWCVKQNIDIFSITTEEYRRLTRTSGVDARIKSSKDLDPRSLKGGAITREHLINLNTTADEVLNLVKEQTKNYIPVRIDKRTVLYIHPKANKEQIIQNYKLKHP